MVYLIICAVFVNFIIEFCLILDFAYRMEPLPARRCKSIAHIDEYDDTLHVRNISA